jgi:hypothetical protein
MTGVLAWNNRCWTGTATELNSAAFMSSSPSNAITKHLFDNYKFDGTTDQAVLRVQLDATYNERMAVGICGLETSSGVASDATFAINLYEGGTLREAVAISALEASGGSIVAVASQAYSINRIELEITANDGDTWLGIGALWASGSCMILDRDGPGIQKAAAFVPMNKDYSVRTPGGQIYTRSTARYRHLNMGLFGIDQDGGLKREALDAIGAAWEYAGNSEPVLAALTTNRSEFTSYGHFAGNPPITNQPEARWLQQLVIEERR